MPEAFENTALWIRTLAPRDGDAFAEERKKLREALLGMREKAKELVSLIPLDCKGLTVHNVTHLDALWETADLIAGPEFPMNAAEAFVFGAAVLIHDAGMAVAAFPGGFDEVVKTTEWTDTVYAYYRLHKLTEPSRDEIQNPPAPFREQILFSVLRALHARQAEKLVSAQWALPSSGEQVRLLENEHFRTAYGRSIGRIAHSHHWDLDRVNTELRESVGAATDLPGEWIINEKTIACLLRCADAAHIDHRRAPSMLYALSKPKGESEKHWRFQHKLNKATKSGDALVYSSGLDFDLSEVSAWWLCFDTIKMIDRELSSCSALMQDIGTTPFSVSRVYGAESPRIFARQVRPTNWQPIEAEIKVSSPAQLAQTLGGRNLYGNGAYPPIRELLQNAVDAVRARRRLEHRPDTWGHIKLTLEASGKLPDEIWLHVDDSGVGMSERILVGPLLDFGRSIWNSPVLQEEFPGLESRGIKPIGKFGIGFFSVFVLGEHVKVISRPYTGGLTSTRVLEFSSLDARPILRNATADELPNDVTTRISILLHDLRKFEEGEERHRNLRRPSKLPSIHEVLRRRVRKLIAAVDVTIEVENRVEGFSYTHNANWALGPAKTFLDEVLSNYDEPKKTKLITAHENLLAQIENASGECLGRAALFMQNDISDYDFGVPADNNVSVGGFIYPGSPNFSYVGAFSGDTDDVKRGTARAQVPEDLVAKWATRQARLVDPNKFQIYDMLIACHTIIRLGGNPGQLPFCFSAGRFISLSEFDAIASASTSIHLPATKSYENVEFDRVSAIPTPFFAHRTIPEMIYLQMNRPTKLFSDEFGIEIFKKGIQELKVEDFKDLSDSQLVLTRLGSIWGDQPKIRIGTIQPLQGEFYNASEDELVISFVRS